LRSFYEENNVQKGLISEEEEEEEEKIKRRSLY